MKRMDKPHVVLHELEKEIKALQEKNKILEKQVKELKKRVGIVE